MQIDGKVAIVTGASSGIGLALAQALSKSGAKVVLAARTKGKLDALAKKLPNSLAVTTDVTKPDEIKKLVAKTKKRFGRIDILINNAGQGYDASVEKININTLHKVFDLDVVGPLIAMQQVIPLMKKQRSGSIVNISSGTALISLPNMSAYSSLKRALVGISLTARGELKKYNINVSVVYPYITETDFEKNTIKGIEENLPMDNARGPFHPADSATYIAQKILDGIKSEDAEIFAHDWMKKIR